MMGYKQLEIMYQDAQGTIHHLCSTAKYNSRHTALDAFIELYQKDNQLYQQDSTRVGENLVLNRLHAILLTPPLPLKNLHPVVKDMELICKWLDYDVNTVLSKRRLEHIMGQKHIVRYLLNKNHNPNLIAKVMEVDRSSILASIEHVKQNLSKYENQIKTYKDYKEKK